MVAQYWTGPFGETPSDRTNQKTEAPRTAGAHILIADDSESDRFFLLRAFTAAGIASPIRLVDTGAEVILYLQGAGKYSDRELYPFPRIIFIDIQMPPPNGVEVLRWKQTRPGLPRILWVAMSGDNSVRSINDAYNAGATTFLTKPLDPADIKNLIQAYEDYWFKTREP